VNLNLNAILDVVVDTQPRAGIEFLALVLEIIGQLPKGHAERIDLLEGMVAMLTKMT
jgi:hypothetical protein